VCQPTAIVENKRFGHALSIRLRRDGWSEIRKGEPRFPNRAVWLSSSRQADSIEYTDISTLQAQDDSALRQ
jgi:hypothetical protein